MLAIKAMGKPRYPFYVNLVINSRCNLKCSYCFGRYSSRKRPDWAWEDLKILIDDLHRRGTRYILVQGGEPLLHQDLGKILRYSVEKGIVTALVTNGTLPDRIREIPEIALMDNICFSLDGNREGNDIVRGKGTFDKVMESIRVVKEVHRAPVRINSTISRYTIGDLDFFAEMVRNLRLEWGINFLFKGDEKLGEESMAPADEEVREFGRRFIEYIQKGYPIFTTSKVVRYVLGWPVPYAKKFLNREDAGKLLGKKAIECQYGNYELVIDEDGRVYPCQGMQGVFDAKNLKEVGFDAAFDHLKTKPCYTCYLTSLINTSAMINWDLGVIGETVFGTFRSRLRQGTAAG
jgi:MoaA/NifB/PqqE/SkfB family radical SAM enzyme